MKESAIELQKRKIRNGIRKQAEKIQREKDKVWDKLKEVDEGGRVINIEVVKKTVEAKTRKLTAKWTTEIEDISLNDSTN